MGKRLKLLGLVALGSLVLVFAASSKAYSAHGYKMQAPADTLFLTLEEALQIAQNQSLTVQIADKEVTKTGYAEKGAYGALFPQVDFTGSYQRTIEKQTMVMNMGGQTNKISMGTDNNFVAALSASMPLVNVQLWKSLAITGKNVELAVEQARASRQNLINQIEQAFYTCLLASDSYDVYKENYQNAKDNYEQTKAKYESGTVAKYDMIRAQVNMQNAEPNVYNAHNSLILALWQLKALMGIDLNTDIACKGSLSDYIYKMNEISLASDSIDLSKNSALAQLDIQEDILSQTYKMQLAKYYPTLVASFSYQWMEMTDNFRIGHFSWNPYSVAGLSLSIPIFSGGQRYYDVRQAKVQRESLELQRENTRRGLIVSVKQNLSSMETALKQYNAAQATVDGAQTGYDIAKKRYEVGSGTVLEMNDAQLALLQARLNLNNSIHAYLAAKSAMDLTLGVNITEQDVYEYSSSDRRPLVIKYEDAQKEQMQ